MRASHTLTALILSLMFLFSNVTAYGQAGSKAEKAARSRLAKWIKPGNRMVLPSGPQD